MTKKDFKLIAEAINSIMLPEPSAALRRTIALHFSQALRPTNPRFNSSKFIQACMEWEYNQMKQSPLQAD